MKKIMLFAMIVAAAICGQAATVGWSVATANAALSGNAYMIFVIGQNDVASSATVTSLLDAGKDVTSYAFGSGTLGSTGGATVSAGNSGKSITVDATKSFTAFAVIFDTATPTANTSKYLLIEGASTLTKSATPTTAAITFATGNQSALAADASNWKSYGTSTPDPDPGSGPEPTSGLLMVLGGALLALRRKQK